MLAARARFSGRNGRGAADRGSRRLRPGRAPLRLGARGPHACAIAHRRAERAARGVARALHRRTRERGLRRRAGRARAGAGLGGRGRGRRVLRGGSAGPAAVRARAARAVSGTVACSARAAQPQSSGRARLEGAGPGRAARRRAARVLARSPQTGFAVGARAYTAAGHGEPAAEIEVSTPDILALAAALAGALTTALVDGRIPAGLSNAREALSPALVLGELEKRGARIRVVPRA